MKELKLDSKIGMLNALSASRMRPQIIGGKPALEKAYPWMVALLYHGCTSANCQFCGGALVQPNWVLTAAHCAAAIEGNAEIDVLLGTTTLAGGGEKIRVSEIIIHEDFDPNTLDNDLALLKLEKHAIQQTVPIIKDGDPTHLIIPGAMGTVIGWGVTSEGGAGSQDLLEVSVPIVSNEDAKEAYAPYHSIVTDNMLAAGLEEGGKDACQGDSGGPFIVKNKEGTWILAGATSWGIGCARPNLPGIYTRLSNYGEWLSRYLD